MFRVAASADQHYTRREFELMGLIGDMVCWHCNYEKSQRMFLTCPNKRDRKDFAGITPNRKVIEKFFRDLLKSKRADAYSGTDRTKTTLIECLGEDEGAHEAWVQMRTAITVRRAQAVCDAIIANVDYFKVRQRLTATRNIVSIVDIGLQQDENYRGMDAEHKTRYRSARVAKQFAEAELRLPTPWKFVTPPATRTRNPNPPIPSSPVTPSPPNPLPPSNRRTGGPMRGPGPRSGKIGQGGGTRSGRRKDRRKTHRRRKLPKLL